MAGGGTVETVAQRQLQPGARHPGTAGLEVGQHQVVQRQLLGYAILRQLGVVQLESEGLDGLGKAPCLIGGGTGLVAGGRAVAALLRGGADRPERQQQQGKQMEPHD